MKWANELGLVCPLLTRYGDTLDEQIDTIDLIEDAEKVKLTGIETAADVTDTTNVVAALTAGTNITIANDGTIAASGAMTDAEIKTAYENNADTNSLTDANLAKLNAIESLADVTDTTNVVSALTAGSNITILSLIHI